MSDNSPVIELPADLMKAISKCPTLPSLPAIAMKIIDASKDPDIGLAEVSLIIRADPALSAKLLKIANSPLYSLRRTIHNLREALTLLGLNAALTIALSFTLIKSLKDGQKNTVDSDLYWRRSLLSATIARHMGFKLGLSNLEDLFLTSLLQDIGILALECSDPDFYTLSPDISNHRQRADFEQENIQVDHASVGAWLLQSWHLPEKLFHSILKSHDHNKINDMASDEDLFQQCVNLSGTMADIWLQSENPDALRENIQHVQDTLNIDDTEFNELLNDINEMLPDITSLFGITITDSATRERVLDEARELLLERNLRVIKQSEHDRRQLEAMEEKTKDLVDETNRDPLTGIYNRKYFEHILEEEFENANLNRWPLSLAFIDLDNFKDVNDNYGHLAGDQVLRDITCFISQHIRQTDVLARYGGDEFILLLPGSTNEVALQMFNRLLKELRNSHSSQINDQTIKISISIGLVSHMDTHDFNNITDLLNAADEALYRVKEAGRDNVTSY